MHGILRESKKEKKMGILFCWMQGVLWIRVHWIRGALYLSASISSFLSSPSALSSLLCTSPPPPPLSLLPLHLNHCQYASISFFPADFPSPSPPQYSLHVPISPPSVTSQLLSFHLRYNILCNNYLFSLFRSLSDPSTPPFSLFTRPSLLPNLPPSTISFRQKEF